MIRLRPRRHARTRISSRVHDVPSVMEFRLVQQCLDPRLDETPRSGIQRLLLTPNDRLGVLVRVEVLLELRPRERVQLLDTGDGCILKALVGAMLEQGGVHLTCANNDAVYLVWLGDRFAVLRVGDDPFEVGITGEIIQIRTCERMTEKRLGEEQDQC